MTTRATRGPRRRTVVALGAILIVLGVFVVRLVDIQVVNADDHVADSLSIGNLGGSEVLAGTRGSIVDENGNVLAESVLVYDAQLSPQLIRETEEDTENPPTTPWAEASEQIATILGTSGDELRAQIAAVLADNPDNQYFELAEGLSTEKYVALNDLGLSYLFWDEPRETRMYPDGAVAGSIVGYLNGAGEAQDGIEEVENSCLSPTDGERTYRRDSDGNTVIPGSEEVTDPVEGGTVQLTINSDLNWYLSQMIAEETQKQGAQAGTVTVVEVKTGKIRAAAEYPTVDPNDINASSSDDWTSKIFHNDFEPGSTFKAITAAALLDTGTVDESTTVSASSTETFPNAGQISDSFVHGAYQYTLAGALIDSSNVALSKFGTMLDPQTRYDYLQKFGVGETTVGFPSEVSGILHPVSEWDARSVYTTTFGQYLTVTAAQVAGAYQAIANDGEKIDLSLVESCTAADGTVSDASEPEHSQVISEEAATELQQMLENVAVQGSLADQIAVPGYRIAIKTGTGQISDGASGYKSGVFFTSMVGFAPAEDPEYVVLVTLDQPTTITSSTANASAFQKAMTQVLKTYRVSPSTEPMGELLPKFQ